VLLEGKTVYGCMLLAVDLSAKRSPTVEGLASLDPGDSTRPRVLSQLQEAFVARDALMCGFCTPGFVTSASALLKSNPNPTHEDIRKPARAMSAAAAPIRISLKRLRKRRKKMRGGA